MDSKCFTKLVQSRMQAKQTAAMVLAVKKSSREQAASDTPAHSHKALIPLRAQPSMAWHGIA